MNSNEVLEVFRTMNEDLMSKAGMMNDPAVRDIHC